MPRNFIKCYKVLIALAVVFIVLVVSLLLQDFPCRDVQSFIPTGERVSAPIIPGVMVEGMSLQNHFCNLMGFSRYAYTLYYPEVFMLLAALSASIGIIRLIVRKKASYTFVRQKERLWLILAFCLVIISYGSLWKFAIYKLVHIFWSA